MNPKYFIVLIFSFVMAPLSYAQVGATERSEWGQYFDELNAKGTIVVVDGREDVSQGMSEQVLVFNDSRAKQRFSPASTFKIPHTLFALDSGVIRDEFQVFKWDGVVRGSPPHNQDQTLRSAMRHSALWVYQIVAQQIGEPKARQYLKQIGYGNEDPTTKEGAYWVDGELSISAYEQVTFLKKLYLNQLPFKTEHQRLLKDVMVVEADRNWILRAKTGWEGRYGWWVGWVEWPTGPVFFALNIDTPNRMDDLYKREAITRKVLKSIQALPSD